MNTHTSSFAGLIFSTLIIFFIPFASFAYVSTAQNATLLSGDSVLYTIDFRLGHEKYAVSVPVEAKTTGEKNHDSLMFEIRDANDTPLSDPSFYAIVVSHTPLSSLTHYTSEKGIGGAYTLAVLFQKPVDRRDERFSLHVTHLPFLFDTENKLQLNTSELREYATPRR